MSDGLAAAVLAEWGGAGPVRCVAERENAVYRAALADGRAVALRLHRRGYRARAAIEAELAWTEALAGAGVSCTAPVRTLSGGWLAETADGRFASVVAWVGGRPLAPDPARFRALGDALARFHAAADVLGAGLPEGALPRWDEGGLLGEAPIWGRFWESPDLTEAERDRLAEMRGRMRQALAAQGQADMGQADIGLIHADVLADNVLDDGAALTLIDFDDCGIGYRGYDLGTALVSHAGGPDYAALTAALVEGYAARRGVRDRIAADVPLFVALRAMASCGWAATRTPDGDPRRRAYAERALALAEAWAAGEGAAAPDPQNGNGAPLARIVPLG